MIKKASINLIVLVFLTLNFTSFYAIAADVPRSVGDIYVQDFAMLLTSAQKAELNQLGRKLEEGTTAQVAVLTIQSLEGESIEEFSTKAFRQYGIGNEENDNGVLFVIALDDGYGEGKVRIEVGYGLEGALPDGKVGRILDEYTMPYLRNNQAGSAIIATYKVLYNEIAQEYQWNGKVTSNSYTETNKVNPFTILITFIVVVIVVILDMRFFGGFLTQFFLIILFRGGRGGGNGGGSRGGGGGSSGGGGAGRSW